MQHLSGLVLVGLFFTASALVPEKGDYPFGDAVKGQSLFADKGCVRCHAVRGAGGRIGPDLGRKVIRGSYDQIAAIMWNHTPSMTGRMKEYRINRPTFEGEELSDLIAFLYLLNYFDEPGDPKVGKTLFSRKGCIRCHRVGEEGGTTGPPLDTVPRSTSPLRLAAALWNHRPAMVSAISASGLEVPRFDGNEILDLFAYLRSQGQRSSAARFRSLGDPHEGEELFETKGCSLCHPFFGDEKGVGPDLGRMELREGVTQIAGQMWNHWPVMAEMMEKNHMPVPEFDEDELIDLFAYLYIARYQGEPGDSARGRAIYQDKGCAVCHGPEGKGGTIEKHLQDAARGKSKEVIMQAMWNHAPRMGNEIQAQHLSWPRFTARELSDLLTFLSKGWMEPSADSSDE